MLNVHNIAAARETIASSIGIDATCRNYSITEYRRPVIGPFRGHISARRFGALTVSDVSLFIFRLWDRGHARIRRNPQGPA